MRLSLGEFATTSGHLPTAALRQLRGGAPALVRRSTIVSNLLSRDSSIYAPLLLDVLADQIFVDLFCVAPTNAGLELSSRHASPRNKGGRKKFLVHLSRGSVRPHLHDRYTGNFYVNLEPGAQQDRVLRKIGRS